MTNTKTALQICKILLRDGQLDRDKEMDLFLEYENPDVDCVIRQFEEEMGCTIKKIESSIYLIPDHDNAVLTYRNREYKESLGAKNNQEAFLSYYIVMFLLREFYNGKNQNPKQIQFLRVPVLVEGLNARFTAILASDRGEMQELENSAGLNLVSIAEIWVRKLSRKEGKRLTKLETVLKACRMMEKEGLLRLNPKTEEIRTTEKLDRLMKAHYLNDSRLEQISSIFAEKERTYAEN